MVLVVGFFGIGVLLVAVLDPLGLVFLEVVVFLVAGFVRVLVKDTVVDFLGVAFLVVTLVVVAGLLDLVFFVASVLFLVDKSVVDFLGVAFLGVAFFGSRFFGSRFFGSRFFGRNFGCRFFGCNRALFSRTCC